jgi:hypothetical protein
LLRVSQLARKFLLLQSFTIFNRAAIVSRARYALMMTRGLHAFVSGSQEPGNQEKKS